MPKTSFPRLRLDHFGGMDGMLITDVAAEMKRPYEVVKAAIHRLGIRDRFPAHGGESSWIAQKGYLYKYEED